MKLLRITLMQYFNTVFWKRGPTASRRITASKSPMATPGNSSEGITAHTGQLRADPPTFAVEPSRSPGFRYYGLDALRGITMFLVVVLHAGLAYAVTPIPNLIWVVRDPAANPTFDVLCWWTLGISSPFYLMSGLFAAELAQARGFRAFLVNRSKRILGPLVIAGLTILPLTFFIWTTGWLITGHCTPREIFRMKFHAKGYQHNLYGPAHLWSLEYLALMLVGYLALLGLRRQLGWRSTDSIPAKAWLHRVLMSPWKPVLLAIPTTLILWGGHYHVGLDAIMDRTNSFVAEPFRLIHNSLFFAVGVSLHHLRNDMHRLSRLGWTYLAISVPVFACRASLIQQNLIEPVQGSGAWVLAASGALFTWLITFGLLGLALRRLNRPQPVLSYLADSSYWVYLVHLPIIGLLQIDLYSVNAPAALKFAVVLTITAVLCLASYQVAVRHTLLGIWLHGRRERPRTSVRSHQPATHGELKRRVDRERDSGPGKLCLGQEAVLER